MYTYQGKLNQY